MSTNPHPSHDSNARLLDGNAIAAAIKQEVAAEVNADQTLGERVGLQETPTIIVLTEHGWIQIKDITQLYATLDQALAEAKAHQPVAAHSTARKPAAGTTTPKS